VWARRGLNRPTRRFPARAEDDENWAPYYEFEKQLRGAKKASEVKDRARGARGGRSARRSLKPMLDEEEEEEEEVFECETPGCGFEHTYEGVGLSFCTDISWPCGGSPSETRMGRGK
jgi:hypothetical protein